VEIVSASVLRKGGNYDDHIYIYGLYNVQININVFQIKNTVIYMWAWLDKRVYINTSCASHIVYGLWLA